MSADKSTLPQCTPGPWFFEAERGRAHPRVYGADNSLVAEVGNAVLVHWERWDADARLIAAAPTMLSALRQEMFDLGNGEAVNFNPGGRFHGWLFRRHPDGQYFSVRKLETVANPAGPLSVLFAETEPAKEGQ